MRCSLRGASGGENAPRLSLSPTRSRSPLLRTVMVTGIDDAGKIRLSRQAVLEGWSAEEAQNHDRPRSNGPRPGGDRGGRPGGDRDRGGRPGGDRGNRGGGDRFGGRR